MTRLALPLAIFVASLLFCPTTQATSLVVDANGILRGATGVLVNGSHYNVEFVDTTCTAAYGACDLGNFVFTTESAALAASKALLDYVLLDVPPLGNFDSNPTLTNGCFFPSNCWILTPYAILGDNFLVTQTYNQPDPNQPDGYFVHQPNGPGLSILGYDASADLNGVLAKWTPVPEPSTITLLGLGLLAI